MGKCGSKADESLPRVYVWSFEFFCQLFFVLHFKTSPKAPYQTQIFTVTSVMVCANTFIEDFTFLSQFWDLWAPGDLDYA